MQSFQLTTAILGTGFALAILYLIGRDRLGLRHGLFWFALAVAAVILGVWPKLMDGLALRVGVHYSPTLLLIGAVIVLFVKALHADIVNTRIERRVRRLTHSMALLYLKAQNGDASPAPEDESRAASSPHG